MQRCQTDRVDATGWCANKVLDRNSGIVLEFIRL